MIALSQRHASPSLEWRRWLRRALSRTRATLFAILDVYCESQNIQRAAHKRHPFAEW